MAHDDAAFEDLLKEDLPRGLTRDARSIGVDRGLLARWAQPDEMDGEEWQPRDGGLLLGYRDGKLIGWNDNRHMLTIAGSRAGKGVSLIIPNLLFYSGSAVVIDPKGENAARTARRRGSGPEAGGPGLKQDVFVLDPFGESGLPTASYNPLFGLDPASPDVIEDIGLLADALITHNESDRHWTESAQALLRALILLVVGDGRFNERRNLITVRRLLMLTDPAIGNARVVPVGAASNADDFDDDGDDPADGDRSRLITAEQALIRILLDQGDLPFGYICVGVGEQLQSMGSKERGSVLSSARTQTQWLDSPKMPDVLSKNDLDLADLKRSQNGMTVYLCLPATRMATHAGWLRLVVLLAIAVMEKIKGQPQSKKPVLFVLDEFAVLGYMRSVEMAAGLMAGFGVQLWPIVQNVGQLKQHYSKTWETFFANAGAVTAFGVSDSESLRVLSEWLGQTGIVARVDSGISRAQSLGGSSSRRDEHQRVPLLADHELRMVFGRRTNRLLVFNVETHPAIVRRLIYHDDNDARFKGLYDPDPEYGHAT